MKTLDELKRFYHQELKPDLQLLEGQRQGIVNKIIYIGIAAFGIAGVLILIFISRFRDIVPFIIFPLMGAAGITGVLGWLISRSYKSEFKLTIINRIVKFVDENLSYDSSGKIVQSEFNASGIFLTKPNRYKGDDLVRGKIGETAIKFSEVDAKYESGGKNRSIRQIFKGLFFIGDFNKHFYGETFVLPDVTESFLGKLGQAFQEWNISRPELVKLEDSEFEGEFVVYSTDQVEARYILSTSLMSRIVDFKRKADKKVHLSFVGSRLYMAVSYTRTLFEPRLFRTLLDFEPIAEYFEDLQLSTGIVEDLNLNMRIWSKE